MDLNAIVQHEVGDSRCREMRGVIRSPLGNAEPVYCLNCGQSGGYSFIGTAALVYLCPECEGVGGGLNLPVIDEDVVRGRKG